MTDAEISRRLALAIGWNGDDEDPDVMLIKKIWDSEETKCHVWFEDPSGEHYWREFDYRDPAVIWPIADRFDAFQYAFGDGWESFLFGGCEIPADTAAKAVALAVIKAHEEKP